MSEEEICFPPIQYSTFVNGDQLVFRGKTGEEFEASVKSFGEHGNAIMDAIAVVKQVVLAKGILTGDSQTGGKPTGATTTGTSKPARARDSAPPGDDSDIPSCKHGQRIDLRGGTKKDGTPYAGDFYCPLKTDNYKEKCPPIKEGQ